MRRLTHESSSYARWRIDLATALRAGDAWDIVTGVEHEPYCAQTVQVDPEGALAHEEGAIARRYVEFERTERAGSVPPRADGTTTRRVLNVEERKEWDVWRRRENLAQSYILATVADAIRLDIEEMLSAKDMWD